MRKQFFKLAMLSLTLLLVGCGKDTEYMNVIPAEAPVVVAFDCEKMAEKCGLFVNNPSESQAKIKSDLMNKLSVGQADLFEKILNDPSTSGIDWTQKAYLFMVPETKLCAVVVSVTDKEKLKFTLEVMGKDDFRGEFHDENGYTWIQSKDQIIAFNDKSCISVDTGTSKQNKVLKSNIDLWMGQSADKSFVSTEYFEKLADIKGEVAVLANLNQLHENISLLKSMVYTGEVDMNDLKYLAGISFDNGQLAMEGQLVVEDKKLLDWLSDKKDVFQKISGKTLKKLPSNTPLWCSVGLDGNELYNQLLDHPVFGKELKNMRLPFNVEGVVRSIDGDISLGFPIGLFMDVTNDELLKVLVGTAKTMGGLLGVSLNEIKEDEYELDIHRKNMLHLKKMDQQPRLGMDGNMFYIVSSTSNNQELAEENSLASAPWADNVKGNLFFGAFSIRHGLDLFNQYSRSSQKTRQAKQYFDYITYSQKDIKHNTIVLSFQDKNRNALEQVLEMAVKRN